MSGVITEFPLPPGFAIGSSITTGADGALWFAGVTGGSVHVMGRFTPAGVFTTYPLPPSIDNGFYHVQAFPDGGVWFGKFDIPIIGRMNTSGVITATYTLPSPMEGPTTRSGSREIP